MTASLSNTRGLLKGCHRSLSMVALLLGLAFSFNAQAEAEKAGSFEQCRAIADMQNTGTAWMSWLTDQVGVEVDPDDYDWPELPPPGKLLEGKGACGASYVLPEQINYDEIYVDLIPAEFFFYTTRVPRIDPWGNPYEFFKAGNILLSNVLAIRSSGSDGTYEGPPYQFCTVPDADVDRDLVWANGSFVQAPASVDCPAGPDAVVAGEWIVTVELVDIPIAKGVLDCRWQGTIQFGQSGSDLGGSANLRETTGSGLCPPDLDGPITFGNTMGNSIAFDLVPTILDTDPVKGVSVLSPTLQFVGIVDGDEMEGQWVLVERDVVEKGRGLVGGNFSGFTGRSVIPTLSPLGLGLLGVLVLVIGGVWQRRRPG